MPAQATGSDDVDVKFGLAGKIVVLSGLVLPSYALFGISPVLPAIAAQFSRDPHAGPLARMLISAAGLTVAVTSPVIGAMADRFGARRVLLIGLIVYAFAGCIPFVLDNLYIILLFRMVMGFSVAAVGTVILVILVTHSTGTARNRWLGYLMTAATLTPILYIPLVGYIGHFGWRWPFLSYAITLPLFVMSIVGFPPDQPRAVEPKAKDKAISARRFALGTPPAFIIFVFAAGTVLVSPTVYIPFRMREMGITDSSMIGMLMIPLSLAGAIAGFSYGWIRSKLSVPTVFVVGFSATAAGLVLTATAHEVIQVIVGQVFTGFGSSINFPNIYGLAAVTGSDAYRARTIGFSKSGVYGGPVIGQILLEPIIVRTNFKFALCIIALSAASFALLYAWQLIGRRQVVV